MTDDLKKLAERLKLNASLCEEMTVAGRFNHGLFGEAAEAILALIRERDEREAALRSSILENARMRERAEAAEAALAVAREGARRRAIDDVLGLLTGHQLYLYRPKAFDGFIEYAKTTLTQEPTDV